MNSHTLRYQQKNNSSNFKYAYCSSKSELLSWASSLLDLKITSIDQTTTGAIFCQLLDACHPGSVKLNKVNWKANCETEYIYNFKLFQQGLNHNYINKPIDINRLANGKQYELNELLQWIYGYYLNNKDNYQGTYNAKRKRNGQNLIFTKHDYKKKSKTPNIRDNYSQSSFSSKKSNNNSLSDSLSNYNMTKLNHSRSRPNFQNNYQDRFNMNNNNYYYNNKNERNDMRNRSKGEVRTQNINKFKKRVLNNNNNDIRNNYFSQNQGNNNKLLMYKPNNYKINNFDNNNILKSQNIINNEKSHFNNYNTLNNFYGSNHIKRNFQNTSESEYYRTSPSFNNNNEEELENINNNLEDEEDIQNENKLDITDFFYLNELETKKIMDEEEKDGNKINDLKKIIRKLRITLLKNEKEMNNINNIVTNINREKNFYLNKLKDIEYLYFNPIIKNDNENKNTILRQILYTDQDSTIFIDENKYAYLLNTNNKDIKEKKKEYIKKKSHNQSSKKNKSNEIDFNNISYISNENRMELTQDNSNNLCYSSKKNFNKDYINNISDSWIENKEGINKSNKESILNNNINNNQNQIMNRDNITMGSYNISSNTNQYNYNSETQSKSSLFNDNLDYKKSIESKVKHQKMIQIKINKNNDNIYNIQNNNINQIQNKLENFNNLKNDFEIENENLQKNRIENGQYDLKNSDWINNGGKSMALSEKKVNNLFDKEYNNDDKNFINKCKSNSIYYDITPQILNESLHIYGQ